MVNIRWDGGYSIPEIWLRCRGTSWAFLIKKINAAKIQFRDYLSVVMRRCSISNETSLLCAYLRPQYSTRESRTGGPKRILAAIARQSDGQMDKYTNRYWYDVGQTDKRRTDASRF